ncbi:MAG: hemolysin family protein [Chitinivibrionales bacterium]
MTPLIEILIILMLIVINGIFAMGEIVIVSSRKTRLQQWANEGNLKAQAALKLSQEPTLFLSTTQAGITLIGIMVGALGEATLAGHLAKRLAEIRVIAPYSSLISMAIVVVCITYVSLIVGELVPKRLGQYSPELLASAMARPMRIFSVIASPLIKILTISTDSLLWSLSLVGVRQPKEPPISEEEIKVMIEQGTQAGAFEETEQGIIERVFRLNDQHVARLMVPRARIVWLDVSDTPEGLQSVLLDNNFTRFPVCSEGLDKILGVVHVKDLLGSPVGDLPADIKRQMRPAIFIPKQMRALKVLELFKQSGMYLGIVIDEYGGIIGLVSLNDILQAIIGNISPLDNPEDPQVTQQEDGSWLMDGMLPIERFKDIAGIEKLPDEEKYQTLGGFIMTYTGSVPSTGDRFEWDRLRITVVDMDGNRIDKVLVTPVKDS